MILDEVLTTLRKKVPIYTYNLTDNFKITNIQKNIIDINIIDFIITVNKNINIREDENCYRKLKVGDGICLSKIKYKFKLNKIKKDGSNLSFYKNQTTITAENTLKFYNGKRIEISGITSDLAYNGIHELLLINNKATVYPEDKIFKININSKINLTLNEINNEGYYNLMFWNSKDTYGSLNDYHKVEEIIDDFNFRIRIKKDDTINKYFFQNDYDDLDLIEAMASANPRITIMATEEKGYNFATEDFNNEISNNWLILTSNEITYSSNGISTEDNSLYFSSDFRLIRNYNINIRLYSNSGSHEISDHNFNILEEKINYALLISLFNQQIATTFLENNYLSYKIVPLEFRTNERINPTLIAKDYPFKITTVVNEEDLEEIDEFEVPLMEFDIKYYKDGIEDENFSTSANNLWN